MEYIRQLNPFYKMMSVTVIIFLISGIFRPLRETEIMNRSRLILRKARRALRSRRYNRRSRTEDCLTPSHGILRRKDRRSYSQIPEAAGACADGSSRWGNAETAWYIYRFYSSCHHCKYKSSGKDYFCWGQRRALYRSGGNRGCYYEQDRASVISGYTCRNNLRERCIHCSCRRTIQWTYSGFCIWRRPWRFIGVGPYRRMYLLL